MKFVCDSCKAQYMISDEKVGPAGVKVRCKKCSHVIHVKKEEIALTPSGPPPGEEFGESTQVMQNPLAGVAAGPGPDARGGGEAGGLEDELGAAFDTMVAKKEAAPEAPPPGGGGDEDDDYDRMSTRVFSLQDVQKLAAETGDTFDLGGGAKPEAAPASSPVGTAEAPIEWYVAIDEQQVGPLTFDQLKAKWDGAAIGPDTLTWRPGLADWRPLSQITELASKLAPRPSAAVREAPIAAVVPASGAVAALAASGPAPSREPLPWERAPAAAAASEPVAPPVDDDVDWKPSAASALASLVEAEMAAAKAPKKPEEKEREKRPAAPKAAAGPARDEPLPPPVETTGIRNLLEDLPEAPPQENSRIIPLPKDAVPGAMPESRPRVERSTLAFERRESKAGSPLKWVAIGGVALLFVFGGVVGVLFATGVIKRGGEPVVLADAGGTNRKPEGDGAAGAPKEPVAKAGEPEKPAEPVKAGEPEKAPEAAKPDEPGKVAEPAKLPDAGAAGASAAKEPEKTPEKTPTRVADARGGRAGGRSFGAPAAAAAAKPEPEPEPEPVKKSGGKSSIDDLFDTEFGSSGAAKAPTKKGGGVGTYIPPAPGAGSNKPKSLGQGDIMGVVVSHKGDIKGCAGKYKASGGGTGTLVMAWTINPNGKTSGVRPKGSDHAPLAACIGGLIKGWRFPEYEGATMAPIEFPFNF